jgi:hypothetical protein
MNLPVNTRANAADLDGPVPKPGVEVNLGLISLHGNLILALRKVQVILAPRNLLTDNCLACYSCS